VIEIIHKVCRFDSQGIPECSQEPKHFFSIFSCTLKCVAGIEAGSDVAIRPLLTSDEIILGRVTFYHIDIGAYDVADGDDSKRYHLPENQVAPLDMLYSQRRLTKGEEVLAIYPETTSFYPAYIVQAPRRTAIGTSIEATCARHCAPLFLTTSILNE
jgi:hypothetical protein